MNPPTFGSLVRLFVPLGVGMFLVSAEMSILNAALARLPHPELALASFAVAMSLSLFAESPIISMLHVSNAMSYSPAAAAMLYRYCWIVAIGLVAIAWGVAATPLYDLLVVGMLGIPPNLAAAARLPFAVLVTTPFVIGSRRVGQGILIRRGQSQPIAAGTAIRVASLVVMLAIIVLSQPGEYAAALAAGALIADLAIETLYIGWLARDALKRQPTVGQVTETPTLGILWRLHAPVGMAALIFTFSRPLISTTLAHSAQPAESIATWAVVAATVGLLQAPLGMIQQVVIARYDVPGAREMLKRFTAILGLSASGIVALIALSPLYDVLIGGAMRLPAALLPLGRPALLLYALAPMGTAWIAYFQGREISERRTPDVRLGTAANLLALAVGLGIVSLVAGEHRVNGIAAAATFGHAVEILVHTQRARRWERSAPAPRVHPAITPR